LACGLYYFEVKIVSKGRDGYMGIGLSAFGVNMNRLPGWDKHSYGYHGDDGHSFCSSGTGQPYGPTFTTGDVIGCGVNLLDSTCFYTKNGHHLGVAFSELPANLYPTVGLQTPGEIVDANFGQQPFIFDIEDLMKEIRAKTRLTVERFPIPESYRNWEGIMNKMVMSYLVHHGYCSTAEAFAKTCGQAVAEDLASMQNRQKIQQLVLSGQIKEAEEETKKLYPKLLEANPDLLFILRCRHFVELVGRSKSEESDDDMSGCDDEMMEIDRITPPQLIQVGRSLQTLSIQMRRLYGHSSTNKKLLENAFSLLAYSNPWESPVGWQLSPRQREPVCAALNSAILQSIELPRTPPLQVGIHHAHLLLKQMARGGGGCCAFVELFCGGEVKEVAEKKE